ncbi:hypothetical protein DFA_10752 [Cavenderia fasciculata]|uniref:GH16 domain-containing protein n=1 Tax=Cavenderia fasciculata TaxID=261658 RepID=F4QBA7_CACFS|nr:uncharacterized protein DFA_10752 [Cavenderia fasciculata]EGG14879.1 hypothetical protein DFA_10752 [Cavenderia fasciculata]|eukprot:XP_004351395.1 hypothetical protein DFA_10752 [Cavenderia fasciculata]
MEVYKELRKLDFRITTNLSKLRIEHSVDSMTRELMKLKILLVLYFVTIILLLCVPKEIHAIGQDDDNLYSDYNADYTQDEELNSPSNPIGNQYNDDDQQRFQDEQFEDEDFNQEDDEEEYTYTNPPTFKPTTPPPTFAPTYIPAQTVAPFTSPPSTFAPSTFAPTKPPTFSPTKPPTLPPTTLPPTTLPPTFAPSTFAPTKPPTLPPTTLPPTTLPPKVNDPKDYDYNANYDDEEVDEENVQSATNNGDNIDSQESLSTTKQPKQSDPKDYDYNAEYSFEDEEEDDSISTTKPKKGGPTKPPKSNDTFDGDDEEEEEEVQEEEEEFEPIEEEEEGMPGGRIPPPPVSRVRGEQKPNIIPLTQPPIGGSPIIATTPLPTVVNGTVSPLAGNLTAGSTAAAAAAAAASGSTEALPVQSDIPDETPKPHYIPIALSHTLPPETFSSSDEDAEEERRKHGPVVTEPPQIPNGGPIEEDSSLNEPTCYEPILHDFGDNSTVATAYSLDESLDYDPFPGCQVDSNNVVSAYEGGLSLSAVPCPSCAKKNTCASVQLGHEVSYGVHTWKVRGSKLKHTATKMALTSGSGSSAHEIFFLIQNTTLLRVGYIHPRGADEYSPAQSVYRIISADMTHQYTNFTIVWDFQLINFYVDGVLIYQAGGHSKVPVPLQSQISVFVTDTGKKIARVADATILSYSYTPYCATNKPPAVNTVTDQTDENGNISTERFAGSPLHFYTTQCTLYRPIWIFNDTLEEGWSDKSSAFRYFNYTQHVHRGPRALFFNLDADTFFYLEKDGGFGKHEFKYVSFWMYGAGFSPNQQIVVSLVNGKSKIASINVSEFIKGLKKPDTWYRVNLPLSRFTFAQNNVTHFHGILFSSATRTFMGSVVLDDVQLNNGTICMTEPVPLYGEGKLGPGLKIYSDGTNLESSVVHYQRNRTLQWYLTHEYDVNIGFEEGALDLVDKNGLRISIYYIPQRQLKIDTYDVSKIRKQPKISMVLTSAGEDMTNPFGIVEYLGGDLPAHTWVSFTVPFEDLGLWDGAKVTGFKLVTDGWDPTSTQGTLYVGNLEVAKFASPPPEKESSSSYLLPNYPFIILILIYIFF